MPKSLILLGSKVKSRRLFIGLTQEKLAEKCSLDRTYISLLERGQRNPSFLTLLKVAKGLEISVSELLHDTEGKNGSNTN